MANQPPDNGMEAPRTVNISTEGFLNNISKGLYTWASKARRTPRSELNLTNTDPALREIWEHWCRTGLWRPVMVPKSRQNDEWKYYSDKPEAAAVLCRFQEACLEQHYEVEGMYGPGNIDAYVPAAENVRVIGESGDLAMPVPPLRASFKKVAYGPRGLWVGQFRLQFAMGVVSANAAIQSSDEDEDGNATTHTTYEPGDLLHPDYPSIRCEKAWEVPPAYADPAEHFKRHLQEVLKRHALDPRSMAVKLSQSWDFSQPERAPSGMDLARQQKAINGHVWSEILQRYVPYKNNKHKENLISANHVFWFNRGEESLQSLPSDVSEDEPSGSEYEPSDEELDWWINHKGIMNAPDWAIQAKRQRRQASSRAS